MWSLLGRVFALSVVVRWALVCMCLQRAWIYCVCSMWAGFEAGRSHCVYFCICVQCTPVYVLLYWNAHRNKTKPSRTALECQFSMRNVNKNVLYYKVVTLKRISSACYVRMCVLYSGNDGGGGGDRNGGRSPLSVVVPMSGCFYVFSQSKSLIQLKCVQQMCAVWCQ